MSNKEQAKRIVDSVRERLKTETDPKKRYALAVIGEEFNTLHMELSNGLQRQFIKEVKKYKQCKKCGESKLLSDFTDCKVYYTKVSGERMTYSYPRNVCNSCLWPYKPHRKDKKNEFLGY